MSEWLNLNGNGIVAVSAAITAAATLALAALTWVLASENRKLRKAGTEPKVTAYLATHPIGNNVINFILTNIGQGPAQDVRFEFICDKSDFEIHRVRLENDPERTAISTLPQGEKMTAFFGMGHQLAGAEDKNKKWLKPFVVKIIYSDINGASHEAMQTLDMSQFRGIHSVSATAPEYRLAQALEKIEGKLPDFFFNRDISRSLRSISEALSPTKESDENELLSTDYKGSKGE